MTDSARQLHASLARIADLPDHIQIWPGHGAGSACGKALGAMPSSTLGYERRTNWAFQLVDQDKFVEAVLEGQPSPPTYFATMKRLNRDGPPLLGPRNELPQLGVSEFADLEQSAAMLDVRPAAEFGAGHIVGTLNIPLIKAFTTWSGWLLQYGKPIALIARNGEDAEEARVALQSIGLDHVVAWFGPEVVQSIGAEHGLATSAKGDVLEAEQLVADGRMVVDIRNPAEWQAGHIPGAVHHPLGTIQSTMDHLDRDTPIAIHCQGGTRSAIGASVLESMGFKDVVDLSGGYGEWRK